jgi:hypothetical protein
MTTLHQVMAANPMMKELAMTQLKAQYAKMNMGEDVDENADVVTTMLSKLRCTHTHTHTRAHTHTHTRAHTHTHIHTHTH